MWLSYTPPLPPLLPYTKVQSVRLVCGAKLHPSFIVSFTFLAFLVVAPQICCFSAHPHPLGSAQSDHLSCHWNHLSYLMTLLISRLFAFTNVDRYILKYIVGVTFVILYVLLFVCTPPILAPSAWIHAFVIHSQPFVSTSLPSSPNVLYFMTIIYVCCYFFSVLFSFLFVFVVACLRSFTMLALLYWTICYVYTRVFTSGFVYVLWIRGLSISRLHFEAILIQIFDLELFWNLYSFEALLLLY